MQDRSTSYFGTKSMVNPYEYDVKRDVYNEEKFQQEHRGRLSSSGNVDIDITTVTHHVQCSCSWHRFQKCLLTLFPCLEWVCFYRFKEWILGDLIAGINVGIIQVPQGLILGLLTRQLIPPLNVSYAAFCSSVIYVIFGSCHHMSIGYFFLVSALMVNVLRKYPFNSGHLLLGTFLSEDFSQPHILLAYNRSLSTVASTTLLTGIIQLTMGFIGFGFIATYLPESVMSAYLAATALHVILSQMTCILGVMISFHTGPIAFFYSIINYCMALPRANSTSILLFLTAIVILRMNKCIRISFNHYPIELPMEVFLIIFFTVLSNKISMATESSTTIIEMIPYSFLFPVTPDLNIFPEIVLEAFSLALVSSSLLVFLGKKLANFHGYKVNSNQDLIAIGLCNIASSFFRSSVCTGAIIGTIIQDKSGGRQQFASLIGASVMLLLMVKMATYFYSLPNAILAGIFLSNLLPYFQTIWDLPNLWKQSPFDFVIWVVTFLAALTLGLDLGLILSVVFAFFIITVRSHSSNIFILGQIPNTNIYRSLSDYRELVSLPGVKIIQCCSSVTFVNIHHLKHLLLKEAELIRIPLTEEEIYRLFKQRGSANTSQNEKICKCACICDDQEPPPRVLYTEIYESRLDYDKSSLDLIRCSPFDESVNNLDYSDQQIQCKMSNSGQQLTEEPSKSWISSNPGSMVIPESTASQAQSRSLLAYSETPLQPSIHTIILDFTMVHFVDAQASVILRQMCNAFRNANVLVLIAGCHSSVVRNFESNDFFDEGITKTQLFLTVHDAVLFALSRKLTDSSELSLDETETVIQETYSETEKMDGPSYPVDEDDLPRFDPQRGRSYSMGLPSVREEDSELDMGLQHLLDPEHNPELEREPGSELEPGSEVEPESEFVPPSPSEAKPKSRIYTYPVPEYWSPRPSSYPSSPTQTHPRTWTGDPRHRSVSPYSPDSVNSKYPFEKSYP